MVAKKQQPTKPKKILGMITVMGYPTEVDGLFIHQTWDPTRPGAEGLWTLSHTKSGYAMGTFGRKTTAMKFALEVAEYQDWTVTKPAPHREWPPEDLAEATKRRYIWMKKDIAFLENRMEEEGIEDAEYDSLYWKHSALSDLYSTMKATQAEKRKRE